MNQVVVVDDQDIPIGLKDYSRLQYADIYRVSALWLTDILSNDCLLTQRKWTKHNDPGKWMSAVSGTIEKDETYDENILHEIEEEIGLTDLRIKLGPKELIDDGQHKYFVQWYTAQANKREVTIRIQEEEVEAYEWVSQSQLMQEIADKPDKFVPSLMNSLKLLDYL